MLGFHDFAVSLGRTGRRRPSLQRAGRTKGGSSQVEVDWSATDSVSGQLSAERRSSLEEYVARVEALRALGQGYSEVSFSGSGYPCLALSFRGGYGVVHLFAEETMFLLAGDGVIADDETVLLPVLDDPDAEFTGAVVVTADRAWAVVREFLHRGSVEGLGDWHEL